MTKFLVSALASFALISSAFSTSITTQAQVLEEKLRIVTVVNLNVRDRNCNKINVIKYGTQLNPKSNESFTCQTDGTSFKMIKVAYNGSKGDNIYVAEMYTKPIIRRSPSFGQNATTSDAVNLRDDFCRRITTLPKGTSLKPVRYGGFAPVCQANGQFYEMRPVEYRGKSYLIATAYLQ